MLMRFSLCCALVIVATTTQAMTLYKSTDANGVVFFSDRQTPGAQAFVIQERKVQRPTDRGASSWVRIGSLRLDFRHILPHCGRIRSKPMGNESTHHSNENNSSAATASKRPDSTRSCAACRSGAR